MLLSQRRRKAIRRGASLGERSNQTSAAERALASEAIRHGQTRELGNAQSATDPQRRVLSDADACWPGGQLRRSRVRVLAVE